MCIRDSPSAGTFNLTSNGESDIFITKLDAQGNFLWAKQIGGTSIDYPGNIAVDANGNVLVGGSLSLIHIFLTPVLQPLI